MFLLRTLVPSLLGIIHIPTLSQLFNMFWKTWNGNHVAMDRALVLFFTPSSTNMVEIYSLWWACPPHSVPHFHSCISSYLLLILVTSHLDSFLLHGTLSSHVSDSTCQRLPLLLLHHLAVVFPLILSFVLHTSPIYSFAASSAHFYPSSHSSPLDVLYLLSFLIVLHLLSPILPLFSPILLSSYMFERARGVAVSSLLHKLFLLMFCYKTGGESLAGQKDLQTFSMLPSL